MPRPLRSPAPLLALAALLLALGPAESVAQIIASEPATVTQTIAGTELEVRYSRPSLRGRTEIFGGITPLNDTWTGGANDATELHLSKDVRVGGVEVPAGAYSVWFEVVEGSDWRMMLHEDTAMFHAPHPPIDEEQILVPVTRSAGAETVETLRWSFEAVEWDGARLTLAWGTERLTTPIEVDPGITLALPEEEAERYTGVWRIDDAADRPSADRIESALGNENLGEAVRRYWETMRDLETEREIEIVRDPETGWLFRTDPAFAEVYALFNGMGEGDPRFELLVPRGEGFFAPTIAVGGELMTFNPAYSDLMEFRFDDDGQAVRFEVRNDDDEVVVTGERVER